MTNHHEATLRALAEHGLRCDMNPTHDMSSLDASEEFWHRYLRMLDANVRQLATNALEAARERPKSCPHSTSPLRYCDPCPVSPCPMEVEAAPSPPDSSQGEHPEDFCELCGGPNIKPWFAPSPIWNKVANDHSVLCPQCFVALARRVGIDPVWRLAPDDYTGPDDDPERMAGRENANKAEPSGLGSVDSADLPNILSPATPPPSSPQVAVADGYAIVPLEPTQEMIEAAKPALGQVNDILALHQARGNALDLRVDGQYPLWHAYKAMVAAAPQSAPKAAEPQVIPFATVQNVVRALVKLGCAVPESHEEQAARAIELVDWLCSEVATKSQWQPIETAPKDGMFLVATPDGRQFVMSGEILERQRTAKHPTPEHLRFNVTHWRPLPAPPEQRARSLAQAEQAAKVDK
jgi:hypothetical protein